MSRNVADKKSFMVGYNTEISLFAAGIPLLMVGPKGGKDILRPTNHPKMVGYKCVK